MSSSYAHSHGSPPMTRDPLPETLLTTPPKYGI